MPSARAEPETGDEDWLELDESEQKHLPAAIASSIVATAERLEHLDPYALIGVEHDAEWSEIERAYRQRLAMFHPIRWGGYDLGDLRVRMESIANRISFAYAFLAEEAALDGSLEAPPDEGSVDRITCPVDLARADIDLSGDRPTFPNSIVQPIPKASQQERVRPPRPPPRKTA